MYGNDLPVNAKGFDLANTEPFEHLLWKTLGCVSIKAIPLVGDLVPGILFESQHEEPV